ncbi:ABC transporter permease [Streptomyces sp. A7024]|uniref:ABC transporter permease n=1 Tax=Streptomyces coryli TaxID=1128680 RepID=A0A6G4TX01_9ACTN|nr:ABC transporter permease [Streptomyces coryli]NGN64529.1 ABC transporter permease [Streptomyces coryli]
MAVITAPENEKATAKSAPVRGRKRRVRPIVLNLIALAIGMVIWNVGAALAMIGDLPGPGDVASRTGEMIGDGQLFENAWASLQRVFLGFLIGNAVAIPIGFLMGWYPVARGLLEPYIQFFRTIPPLAIIPLAIVLMGIGETPKVFVIFIAAFMATVVAAFQGVTNVDRTLVNAARVLGASDGVIFLKVVMPASVPFLLVGMRIGLGSAWATVVAAEIMGAESGVGQSMMQAQTYYDMPTIVVGVITIGVIGLVMDRLLLLAERRLTGWQETR